MNSKKCALISVYDKSGIADFAKSLVGMGWEIISTGGTKSHLEERGIPVIDVSEVTGFPEILGGRVKTLTPQVFSGILYKRQDEEHLSTMDRHSLGSIDMVVNTLYPFVETLKNPNSTEDDIIEKIDIGGPSMIRAAAKNHRDVYIVTKKEQYELLITHFESGLEGDLDFKKRLAMEAFRVTAAYDIAIANYFQNIVEGEFHGELFLHYSEGKQLRYGENPHQRAIYYLSDKQKGTLAEANILQGKELSYNNIMDITAAIDFIRLFDEAPTAVAIKHTNPCGIASGKDILEAFIKCYDADPVSIFGGIVVVNEKVTKALAEKLTSFFLEIVIAPSYEPSAVETLSSKPNLRVIEMPNLMENEGIRMTLREVSGGMLVQDSDMGIYEKLECVTETHPTQEQMKELIFAYKAAKCVKSNGIAITKDRVTLGLGIGDVNRYFAIRHALEMSGDAANGAVVASDGFFPFADSIKELANAGIAAVIQPGGSIRDQDTIDVANQYNISMIYAHMRHFRH